MRARYVKYGGVKFVPRAPRESIDRYIREMSEKGNPSLYEVVRNLERDGLISIINDGDLMTSDTRFRELMLREYAQYSKRETE